MRASPLLLTLAALALGSCASDAIVPSRPGNYLVVVNHGEDSLSVIEPNSGHTRDVGPTGSAPREAAASRDGRWVVVGGSGDATLTVYDLAERRRSTTIDLAPHARPHGIAFLDNRSTVLVTSEASDSVLVVGLDSRRVERAIPSGGAGPHGLALSPDRRVAYTANLSGSVSAYDLAQGELLRTAAVGVRLESIAASPDGRELWVVDVGHGRLVALDARTLERLAEVPCAGRPARAAPTADGAHVLVTARDPGELVVVDALARREVRRVALGPIAGASAAGPAPVGLLVEPRGRYAFVALTAVDRVAVVDLSTWELAGRFETGDQPAGMAWAYLWDPGHLSRSFLD